MQAANLRARHDRVYAYSVGCDYRALRTAAEAATEPVRSAVLDSMQVIADSLSRACDLRVDKRDDWRKLNLATAKEIAAHLRLYYLSLKTEFGEHWTVDV